MFNFDVCEYYFHNLIMLDLVKKMIKSGKAKRLQIFSIIYIYAATYM